MFDLQLTSFIKTLLSNENQTFFIFNSFTASLSNHRTEIGGARGESSKRTQCQPDGVARPLHRHIGHRANSHYHYGNDLLQPQYPRNGRRVSVSSCRRSAGVTLCLGYQRQNARRSGGRQSLRAQSL